MESINEPCVASKVVTDVQSAIDFIKVIGLPAIVRPAYTLGGTGRRNCIYYRRIRRNSNKWISPF